MEDYKSMLLIAAVGLGFTFALPFLKAQAKKIGTLIGKTINTLLDKLNKKEEEQTKEIIEEFIEGIEEGLKKDERITK